MSPIERLIELDEEESLKQDERLALLSLADAVIEALPDALIVADSDGKVILFNERAELMFGHHRSEAIGKLVETLIPDCSWSQHIPMQIYSRFNTAERVRAGSGVDLVGIHRDGHEFPVDITLARMVVPKGVFSVALTRYSSREMEAAQANLIPPGPAIKDPDAET